MPRTITWSVPTYPPLFTPAQLQPRLLFSLGFQASFLWLREHLGLSHRQLLQQRLGFVIYGAHLTYRESVDYFATDELELEVSAGARKGGMQAAFECEFRCADRVAADLDVTCIPLWISEDDSHSAVPTMMEEPILGRFRPDEIEETGYEPTVPPLAKEIAAHGERLGEVEERITVHRHLCEFADQWYFAELSGFIAAGRERLLMEQGSEQPLLRKGLSLPLWKVDMLFTQPAFLLDQILIRTRAYKSGNTLAYVHEAVSEQGDVRYAQAVERFQLGEE